MSRVLLVDDEPAARALLVHLFPESEEHQLTEAASGAEARAAFESRDFDLILLDVMLPDTSGLELLREIRAGGPNLRTPVIMISASQDSDVIVTAFESGANDYIPKPIQSAIARARIRNQLRTAPTSAVPALPGADRAPGPDLAANAGSVAGANPNLNAEAPSRADLRDGQEYHFIFLVTHIVIPPAIAARRAGTSIEAFISRILRLFQEAAERYDGFAWSRKEDACVFGFPHENHDAALCAAIELRTLFALALMSEDEAFPTALAMGLAAGPTVYRDDRTSVYSAALNESAHLAAVEHELHVSDSVCERLAPAARYYLERGASGRWRFVM